MTTKHLGFKRLSPDAILPTRAHATDSGFDLYAVEDTIVQPGETAVIKTGIAVQLPKGCEGQVRPKSGITSKTKLRVQLGTVDNGYTGEVGVIVDNTKVYAEPFDIPTVDGEYVIYGINGKYHGCSENIHEGGSYIIRKHDKIAQLVVQYLPQVEAVEVAGDLDDSTRGNGGFGSTGVKKECDHGRLSHDTYLSDPPIKKCLDCGAYVRERDWYK